jgi:hypothetical protein
MLNYQQLVFNIIFNLNLLDFNYKVYNFDFFFLKQINYELYLIVIFQEDLLYFYHHLRQRFPFDHLEFDLLRHLRLLLPLWLVLLNHLYVFLVIVK